MWVAPFLCFIVGYFITGYVLRKSDLVAPNVIGKSLQEGIALLSENHLGLRLLHQQEDSTLPEGTILDQLPRPQQKIRPNQNVFVTVSIKQRTPVINDFWGKREQEAIALLAKGGFEPRSVYIFSTYPRGMCIGQSPFQGQAVANRQVTLYVSAGSSPIAIMPQLKGFGLKNIQELLQQSDVRAEVFHANAQPADHSCEQCIVVEQQPEAGAIVDMSKSLLVQLSVAQAVA